LQLREYTTLYGEVDYTLIREQSIHGSYAISMGEKVTLYIVSIVSSEKTTLLQVSVVNRVVHLA